MLTDREEKLLKKRKNRSPSSRKKRTNSVKITKEEIQYRRYINDLKKDM